MSELPVLYSFRRCPYAIRARLALKAGNIAVELREVLLAEKPEEMLNCSPKGTVPVLQLADATVIDESREIMDWALQQCDPNGWLPKTDDELKETNRLIETNDNEFKQHLDHYKYADRFPERPMEYYRNQAEPFLKHLEDKLCQQKFLISDNVSLADIAIFPFVRQFSFVDKDWFNQTDYKKLQVWLDYFLTMVLFNEVMKKYPRWQHGDEVLCF
jgi:glutathione S-transferase